MRSPTQSTVCFVNACDNASKSNIGIRYLCTSAEAVGGIQIVLDIKCDSILKRREAAVIAGSAQLIDVGLREILIAAADLLGHVGVLNARLCAEGCIGGDDQILEASRIPGTHI